MRPVVVLLCSVCFREVFMCLRVDLVSVCLIVASRVRTCVSYSCVYGCLYIALASPYEDVRIFVV